LCRLTPDDSVGEESRQGVCAPSAAVPPNTKLLTLPVRSISLCGGVRPAKAPGGRGRGTVIGHPTPGKAACSTSPFERSRAWARSRDRRSAPAVGPDRFASGIASPRAPARRAGRVGDRQRKSPRGAGSLKEVYTHPDQGWTHTRIPHGFRAVDFEGAGFVVFRTTFAAGLAGVFALN
jgi:hypothetical protein